MSALAGRLLQAVWGPAACCSLPACLWHPVNHSLSHLANATAQSQADHPTSDASLSDPQPSNSTSSARTLESEHAKVQSAHTRGLSRPLPKELQPLLSSMQTPGYRNAVQLTQLRCYMRGAYAQGAGAAPQAARTARAGDPHAERRLSGFRASTSAAPRAYVEVSHGAIPRVLQLCRNPLPPTCHVRVTNWEQLWPEGDVSGNGTRSDPQPTSCSAESPSWQNTRDTTKRSNASPTTAKQGAAELRHRVVKGISGREADSDRTLGMSLMAARSEAELAVLVRDNMDRFTPIHVSQAMLQLKRLAGARKGCISVPQKAQLVSTLADHITENTEAYDYQGLGICAYALARLEAHDEGDALAAIGTRGMEIRSELSTQNIVNILWAHGKLRTVSPAVFSAFAEEIMQRLPDVGPQDLSNTAWAFARMGNDHPMLFEKLADAILQQSWSFLPQHISSIAWAYATLQIECQPLLVELGHQAAAQAPGFSPQGLANLLWSYAALGFRHREMLRDLSPVIVERATSMRPQELANAIWAFANLGIEPQEGPEGEALICLVSVSLQKAQDQKLSPQGISNLAWSLAVLGVLDYDTLANLAPSLERCADAFTREAWLQIYMANLWVATLGKPGSKSALPAHLLEKAQAEWLQRHTPQRAETHGQPILDALNSLAIGIESIGVNPGPDVCADIVISLAGHRVGLLIGTGPHFPSNDTIGNPRGQLLLRQRLLEKKGLVVTCLPMIEWMPLADNNDDMIHYLRGKLGDVVHTVRGRA